MSAVTTKNLEIFNAKQFLESVSEPSSSNVYICFGKTIAWANDADPLQANTSQNILYEVWRNMVGGKRITGNDIKHVVPRINWVVDTVYHAYDNTMTDAVLYNDGNKFYVITDEFNVYKCLANANGDFSTVKPTSTITTSHFQTSDRYIWKYMYTLNAEEQERYLTTSFMPVKTLTTDDNSEQADVQANAIDGAIHAIFMTNLGSNYTSSNISVTITGDGNDATADAQWDEVTNQVAYITVTNKGYGYTYANVEIISDTGSGATARAIISPKGGHGKDPVKELGGSYLMITPKFQGSEDGQLVATNDYRQISIIDNPYYYGSNTIAGNTVVSQVLTLALNGVSVDYQEDEYVYQGPSINDATFKGIVTQWDEPNNIIKLTNTVGTPNNDLLIGYTSTATRYLNSVTYPDLEPYSGNLLYIDNITPIERSEDQTESFQIVLKF